MAKVIVCRNEVCPHHAQMDRPMRPLHDGEYPEHVLYVCSTCNASRLIHKSICGGTIGQGRKMDGTRTVMGRGV